MPPTRSVYQLIIETLRQSVDDTYIKQPNNPISCDLYYHYLASVE